tara:strand:- start:318 stop:512 length:195 start_codon:yes stop_codon:yes gene_type:complete
MDINQFSKQLQHNVLKAFKDGVADGLLHGERDEKQGSHYYKQGYDYGVYLYSESLKFIDLNREL